MFIFVPKNGSKMKQKAIELLKDKFAGVADSIIERIAAKVATGISDEEALKAAVEKVTFQTVLESYGDSRANEAQQTAVKNYEKKYGLKDGKTIEQQPDEDEKNKKQPTGDDVPAWAKAIIESNEKLKDELAQMKANKVADGRKARLNKIVEQLPESLRKAYGRTNVESLSDEEFDNLTNEVNGEVEKINGEISAKKTVFGIPMKTAGGTATKGKEATKEETDAVVSKINIV